MRALWLHYPQDEQAAALGNQYLWGRDLLVAPVFERGATMREVYLPAGTWYDWWTNAPATGHQTITRKVDLSTMPIYVRAGAIIPVDPIRQYTGQVTDTPLTIRIYRGANGDYTLYEDDGISQAYLQGAATLTHFSWNNAAKKLSINTLRSSTNQPVKRMFNIVLLPEGDTLQVKYTGVPVSFTF